MGDQNTHTQYTLADIQRYLHGNMSAGEMHEMERAALQDSFLADAMDGYAEADTNVAASHLNDITALLQPQKTEAKVVAMPARKNIRLRIAAMIVVIAGAGLAGLFLLTNHTNENALAVNYKQPSIKKDSAITQETLPYTLADSINTSQLSKAESKKEAEPAMPLARKSRLQANTNKKEGRAAEKDDLVVLQKAQQTADIAALDKSSGSLAASAPVAKPLSGTVVDASQRPVPNAIVKLADSSIAVTDRNGEFAVNSNNDLQVNVSAYGYKPGMAIIRRNVSDTIILKEKKFLLSEVPETDMKTIRAKKADSAQPIPVGGWQSFQEYVYKKLDKQYDSTYNDVNVRGNLELEFSIDDNGLPYDFKVLYQADDQLTKDAIKAIAEGPKWTTGEKKKQSRVRVKF